MPYYVPIFISSVQIERIVSIAESIASLLVLGLFSSGIFSIIDVNLREETGKTSAEHLASEVTEKDCQFIRVIDGMDACMTREEEVDYILSKNCETITWNWLGLPSCKE